MGLSRKREKEFKKLKTNASDLWDAQRDVLDHAGSVLREAGRQLGNASREQVAPRVRSALDDHVVPAASTTIKASRAVVDDASNRIMHEVLPSVTAAVSAALAGLDLAHDPRVREVSDRVHKSADRVQKTTDRVGQQASKLGKNAGKAFADASDRATKAYSKVAPVPRKKSHGFGGYLLIALGVVAVVGIAYAAWQTLRADDELWVIDDSDESESSK